MDAHDWARLVSLLAAERSAVSAALERFRTHHIGGQWRGQSRNRANAASEAAMDACYRSLAAIDDAGDEARRMWRAALSDQHFLGV